MADPEAPSKPAILQESHFIVEEGILHRALRTGAIWLNKLFFSSAALWAIWLVVAYTQGIEDCAAGLGHVGNNSTEDLSIVADGTCSVMLTTTSKYLGGMTLISFLASITLGLLGLVVGKRVIETTPTSEEFGAEEHAAQEHAAQEHAAQEHAAQEHAAHDDAARPPPSADPARDATAAGNVGADDAGAADPERTDRRHPADAGPGPRAP